jgi:hypothetical protein
LKNPFIPKKEQHHLDGPEQIRAEHLAQALPDKHAFPSKRGKNLPATQPGAQVEQIQQHDHGHPGVKNKSRQHENS